MISIDILETFQNQTGYLLAITKINNPKPFYVGLLPLNQTKIQQRIPIGTQIVGILGDENSQKYQKHTLEIKKIQRKKNNIVRYEKQLKLINNKNQQIIILNAMSINNWLSTFFLLNITSPPNFSKILGYTYANKNYGLNQQQKLFESICIEQKSMFNKLKQYQQITKTVIELFRHNVKLIVKNQKYEQNQLEFTNKPLNKINILGVYESIDFKNFQYKLKCHLQKINQSKQNQLKQLNVDYLQFCHYRNTLKISNPHRYLPIEMTFQYKRTICKGIYQYYHYGDQNFNDKGWGCAYRALQTILSWFIQQNLAKITIPTISEIQKILFQLDKSRNLLGTTQWIGANQGGYIINKLCKVECKISFLQNGQDIIEKVPIFQDHFKKQGTPIMYGGAQYAYTILGINYSWELGECQFLILDPHYVFEDKVNTIIEKKGIFWADKKNMFKKGVFYNFCLPQVNP